MSRKTGNKTSNFGDKGTESIYEKFLFLGTLQAVQAQKGHEESGLQRELPKQHQIFRAVQPSSKCTCLATEK